ncbi:MAG: DUF11 domain-containing protein, partial [Candidatus Krumholzibacteria bacterium]|nr:DUF11 domain-containing protein [Candidatus Krumholzibacteria bacterium]
MAKSILKRLKAFRKPGRRRILFLYLFSRIAFFPTPAYAIIPPSGQVISSRSEAVYEANGSQYNALSNEVSLSILPVYGPLLVPNGTTGTPAAIERAFSGETVTFPFRLTNTGNTGDTFEMGIIPRSPSDFIAASAAVYIDEDGDSLIDPGEQVYTAIGPLGPGEVAALLFAVELPVGLTGGETAHIDLTARSVLDTSSADEGNVVRIVARDEARVELLLESDVTDVLPGDGINYTIRFSSTGERSASNVAVTDYIDYGHVTTGTEFIPGSVATSPPGMIEYFDIGTSQWVEVAPPADRVKGIRLSLGNLAPNAEGSLSFAVTVADDRRRGEILNTADVDYTGGDVRPYHLNSNEVTVLVGPLSRIYIGPSGNPTAESGSPEDCVVVALNGNDTTYTFWHEVLNDGNFTDTLDVVLADSTVIPTDWDVEFIDSTGAPLPVSSGFTAGIGAIQRGGARILGLKFRSSPERFRRFLGRELTFDVEAVSIVNGGERDGVRNVLLKADMPLISVNQSIREPTALVGDVLSCIVTVENLTEETSI